MVTFPRPPKPSDPRKTLYDKLGRYVLGPKNRRAGREPDP